MNVPTFGWHLTKEAEEYLQDLADELEVPDTRYTILSDRRSHAKDCWMNPSSDRQKGSMRG
ncbi:hypothetical protein [Bosea lathyri]|uniref:Uncharacterized protein n=1 Tax=Bosea lathyri TaxID=1036778 RepID=A0A1H5V9V7_9HYPH|nr:hypothetical protein [Bosea lathyri]SEF84119.1 hypothetical protein SAMN04488115_102221 [Bosea lathyri]